MSLDNLSDRVWCAVRAVIWSDLGMDEDTITEVLGTDWRYAAATRKPLAGMARSNAAAEETKEQQ